TADGIIDMHECGYVEGWNSFRAAMLTSEPVSNRDELADEVTEGMQQAKENLSQWLQEGKQIFDPAYLEDRNSPVIPKRWIPVSERMPEDSQWCAVNTEYGYYVQCWSEGQGWLGDDISIPNIDVTHWMPLPAAPKPEVK
ncbi:hypothetical protein CHU32_09645, partial [Superficieibacter electus]